MEAKKREPEQPDPVGEREFCSARACMEHQATRHPGVGRRRVTDVCEWSGMG